MKSLYRHLCLFTFLGVLFLVLTGCNQALHTAGRTVASSKSLPLVTPGSEPTTWQTNDVKISYRLIDQGRTMTITGELTIRDSVIYSYPLVKFFNLYLHFVDQNGMVISRYEISPLLSRWNEVESNVAFSKNLPKPAGTSSIAFGYWGTFLQQERYRRLGGEEWEIFHSPFEQG